MLTCVCIANKEETEILTPCPPHATWAKTYAAQTWRVTTGVQGGGQRVHEEKPR